MLSFVTVVAFFLVAEGMLRVAGFQIVQDVEHMEFTFPIDEYNTNSPEPFLRRDPELFWRPQPNVVGHNSIGFYGPEFTVEKPAGVLRIVCLGDSCTHFGPISYPDMLRAYLEKVAPGKFEVINAGVIGYTSFQGKKLLETEVLAWKPDIVSVYFGWNDHWLARGLQDKQQTQVEAGVTDGLHNVRLFQLIRSLAGPGATSRDAGMRVEPEDYRSNLAAIGQQCKTAGIQCFYLTAPHAFDLGVPPYLVDSGEAKNLEDLIQIHSDYNNIVREVAESGAGTLIDLDREIDQMNKPELFIDDHIHLSQTGRLYVAQRFAKTLQATGQLTIEETP